MSVAPDIAHLGPVEIFTPKAQESLDFFVDIMGMEIFAQEDQSAYLRGWGDYQQWSVKLTESHTNGMGVLGLRAWNQEALERRVAAVEAWGLGEGWNDGDVGRGPLLPLPRPQRPRLRALLRGRALRGPRPTSSRR